VIARKLDASLVVGTVWTNLLRGLSASIRVQVEVLASVLTQSAVGA
jgi:hypothetical protein